jgi:radical SAM superfamily enzyme YgiQ (UPF0313 family)
MSRRPASDKYDANRRALLERETIHGPLSNSGGIFEIVLASPREYRVAMSSLRFQNFFRQLASWPETTCERAFFPDLEEFHWRSRYGSPAVTLESGKSIRQSDLLAFAVTHEDDYIKLLQMMSISGMELRTANRTDKWPLVIVSGIPVTANPMPLSQFMDAFVIGETESSVGPVLDTIKSLGAQGASKNKLLRRLASLPGIYVPSVHEIPSRTNTIMRQWAGSDGMGSASCVTSPDYVHGDLVMAEISRGCPFNCKFCQAGYVSLPYRECKLEDIEDTMSRIPEGTSIVLTGCSPRSHPELKDIMKAAARHRLEVTFESNKVDGVDRLEATWGEQDDHTFILAPETGTDSLRKVIGKKISNEKMLASLTKHASDPLKKIHIYFMIGLPFETDLDREAIVEFVAAVRGISPLPITVTISAFVPKPCTAFQWSAMARPADLKKWMDEITPKLKKLRKIKVHCSDPREAHIQALLARGDRRVSAVLEERLRGAGWNTAFEKADIDIRWVFEDIDVDTPFDWDFLNMGFGHTRLSREYQSSLSAHQSRMKALEKTP